MRTVNRPKFLIVGSTSNSLIHFRGNLINDLLKKNFEVHAAAPFNSEADPSYAQLVKMGAVPHSIPIKRTGLNPIQDLRTLYLLIKYIRKTKPDFVLSYTIKPVIYVSLAARISRVKHIFNLITGLGYTFELEDERKAIIRRLLFLVTKCLYRGSLKGSELVFFQNPDDERLFRQLKILKSQTPSYVVNGSGVDISHYQLTPLPTADNINFLFIGRLLINKGVRDFVKAAKEVLSVHKNVSFTLVGRLDDNPSSISRSELESWIKEGLVTYLGEIKDVRTVIKTSNVFVLPSYREGTPRSVLEAMSMGRPVITTDAPGCRDTVRSGYNGFLVPIKSPSQLAARMNQLIADPGMIADMAKNSRKMALDKYDVNVVNATMFRMMGINA